MSDVKFTPGPWRWEVNEHSKRVQLCGGDPRGGFGAFDLTVMGFVRWGMGGAAPEFIDRRGTHPRMERVEKFAVIAPGRKHHANWFKLVDHPDAALIAAAPQLFEALEAVSQYIGDADYSRDGLAAYEKVKAALAAARGGK